MAVDLATLALKVDNTDAIAKLDKTAASIDNVDKKTNKLHATLADARARWSSAAGTASRFGDELDRMGKGHAANIVAVERHSLALGRINMALEGLAVEAVGVNSKLGTIATKFAEFGVGGPEVAVVLAGLAAIAFAFEKITEASRDAEAATARSVVHLQDLLRKQRQGDFGSTKEDVGAAWAKLLNVTGEIRGKEALITPGNFLGNGTIEAEIKVLRDRQSKLLTLIRAGNVEIDRVNEEHTKNATDEADKEWAHWQQIMREKIDGMKATEDAVTRILRGESEKRQRITEMTTLGIRPGQGDITSAMANTATGVAMRNQQIGQNVFDNLAKFAANAKVKLTQGTHDIDVTAEVIAAMARKEALKSIALNSVLGLAGQIGGGVGMIGSIVSGGMSGAAGGPWGVAIGAVSALASGILSLGKSSAQAAAQIKAMKDSVTNYLLGVSAANGNQAAQLQLQINQAQADADAAKAALAQAYPEQFYYDAHGGAHSQGRGAAYTLGLVQINVAEQQRIAHLKEEAKLLEESKIKDAISAISSVIDNLAAFKGSLALSDLSPLSPTQKLAEARRQYEDILGKAKLGDQDAANQLPQFAQAFLNASRGVNASGSAYQRDYARVLSDTNDLMKLFQDQRDVQQKALDALLGIQNGATEAAKQNHYDLTAVRDAMLDAVTAFQQMGETMASDVALAT